MSWLNFLIGILVGWQLSNLYYDNIEDDTL
jgi:hypothetical protein